MVNEQEEQEKKELRTLIFNRKINFVDFYKSLGLSRKKRESFLLWYWDNIEHFTLLKGLEEFKKIK